MTARVGIEFVTGKAQAALRQLRSGVDQVKRSVDGLSAVTKQYQNIGVQVGKKVGDSFKKVVKKIDGLNSKLGGLKSLLIGLGGAATLRGILQTGISAIEAERKIKLLTASTGDYQDALGIAARAATKFGISQTEANSGVARLLARLKPMGLSLTDIETAYNGFNTAATLAGATASESAGAFLQLTQALGSGVLRGQELNSILEQAPLVASAIAIEMGVAVESLKDLGEQGAISSKVVLAALGRVEKEGADSLTEALKGPGKQFQRFNNAIIDLNRALSEDLLPIIIPVVQKLTQLIKLFTTAPPEIKKVAAGIAGLVLAMSVGLPTLALFITSVKTVALAIAAIGGAAVVAKTALVALPILLIAGHYGKMAIDAHNAAIAQEEVNEAIERGNYVTAEKLLNKELERQLDLQKKRDDLLLKSGKRGSGMRNRTLVTLNEQIAQAGKNIDKLAGRMMEVGKPKGLELPKIQTSLSDEEENRLKKLADQNKAAKQRRFESQAELAIQKEISDLSRIDLEFDLKRAKLQREYVGLFAKSLSDEERNNLAAGLRNKLEALSVERNKAISGHMQDQFNSLSEVVAEMQEMQPLANGLSDEFKSLANTINNEIVSGIEGVITGTKTLGQVASSILKSIGNQLLQTAIMGSKGSGGLAGGLLGGLSSIFGGGGGSFAPDLKTSGIKFFASGGFVDQPTRAVIGEGGDSEYVIPSSKMNEAMGRYARGARGSAVIPDGPGGDASGGMTGGGGTIDVSYSVERINNVDYVSAAEFERGMAQAAKRGAELGRRNVYSDLVNKRSIRSRVGV